MEDTSRSPVSSLPFREIWLVDFEFSSGPGERPVPLCVVAREFRTGRTIRVFGDELHQMGRPPYSTGRDDLFVAYYSSAEVSCHLVLGWPTPYNILDLFTEFRRRTNGLIVPCGNGLLGAMLAYGLTGIEATEKDAMRQLALRGGSYTSEERAALLDYCESDVVALDRLLPLMLPDVDLLRALVRGRFMGATAHVEHNGVPIDSTALSTLKDHWPLIQLDLIGYIDEDYHVFEGTSFRRDRFQDYLVANNIPWPRLPSGELALDDDTFKDMARAFPVLAPLRELRVTLSQMRLIGLEVGGDGRNRTILSAFSSKTGRTQPSNTKFIFGPATWLRSLIKPVEGYGIAYIDYSQQEFAIAAALSGDINMMAAYVSGDPYMTFAIQAGAAPVGATKKTHGEVRDRFKTTALAVQYGAGPALIAARTGLSEPYAHELLQLHQRTYPTYWEWSRAVVDFAMLHGYLDTTFGWRLHVGQNPNPRSLANYPVQGNGAEMLRLAVTFAVEDGVKVCAPVHDALLVEAPLDRLDEAVATARKAMADASKIVLDGFEVRTDVKVVRYPDRYADERGIKMWDTVQRVLREKKG